jgi:hypothetical protein
MFALEYSELKGLEEREREGEAESGCSAARGVSYSDGAVHVSVRRTDLHVNRVIRHTSPGRSRSRWKAAGRRKAGRGNKKIERRWRVPRPWGSARFGDSVHADVRLLYFC